jgi:glyoxylase-like metal-dependent hydrolase (beta-lactamase superfamily II)
MKEIGNGIFAETEYARVTVGAVLTDEGWVCVDTPSYPQGAQAWYEQLTHTADKPILYIINTDAHRDRIICNMLLGAPVVAHEQAAAKMLSLNQTFVSQAAEELGTNESERQEIAGLFIEPPQVSFGDSLTVVCGGREITALGRPSASAGSAWVIFPEDQVLFTGDTVVKGVHPYMEDCVSKAWLEALGEMRRRFEGWTLVPGRGPVTDVNATEPISEYVRIARRRIAGLHRAGRPRSEVASLVGEFLEMFAIPPNQREAVHRRTKAGLDVIYDEYKASEDEEEGQ